MLVFAGTALNLFVTVPWGVPAYFAGLVVVQLVATLVMLLTLLKIEAVSPGGLAAAFFPPVACAAAAYAFANGVGTIMRPHGADFLPAAIWGTTFLLSYVATLRLLFSTQLRQLVSYLPGRVPISRLLWLAH